MKPSMKDEIHHEFQLERMILFSDAVFAIVMTLMAIEIRLPEIHTVLSEEELITELKHLIPTVIAYVVSFGFIGSIWYRHLKLFSLLKNYDKGLVIRNLVLLFSLGFFPFSVTMVTKLKTSYLLTMTIYFAIILFCKSAQLILEHYILVKKPILRNNGEISSQKIAYKKSLVAVFLLFTMFSVVFIIAYNIEDPAKKPSAWMAFLPFPLLMKLLHKRIK